MLIGKKKSAKQAFVVLLMFYCNLIFSYNKVDSLKSLLHNAQNDSISYIIQHELANELLMSNHSEALNYYTLSKTTSINCNDSTHIVYNLLGICDIHSMMGQYKKSLNTIQEALSYAGTDLDLLASCHSRLAIEYDLIGKTDLSILNDRLSLKYNKLLNDSLKIAYDLHNIGSYYIGIQEPDSAIYYYKQSNNFLNDPTDPLKAYNYSRLGIAYSDKNQFNIAIGQHEKALLSFTKESMLYDMAMEEYYTALTLKKQEKYTLAIKHLNNSLNYSSVLNNHELFRTNYELLYNIYNTQKKYKTALKYALLNMAYSDSLEKKNQNDLIKNIESQHKLVQQEKILEATRKSNTLLNKQKRTLSVLSVVALSLLLISIIALFLINKARKRNKTLTKKLDATNSSMQKILSIIGHDLKDSVGNLKNFTQLIHHNLINNKSINTLISSYIPMVNSTHNLLETLLLWSRNNDDNFVPNHENLMAEKIIAETIDHLSHLANAKNITLNNYSIAISFYADKNMLLTVLRNLISNAIKFSEPGSNVDIFTEKSFNNIKFTVTDYGVGMTQEQLNIVLKERIGKYSVGTAGEQGSGLGLALCNTFIKKHNGRIYIQSVLKKGSSFIFEIPILNKVQDPLHQQFLS